MDYTEREKTFLELAERTGGIEVVHGFRDEVDHFLGCKDGTCWFVTAKEGSVKETYIGTLKEGTWTDRLIKGKGKKRTEKSMPEGSTIRRVLDEAYLAQDEDWVLGKKTPSVIEDTVPRYHYTYGFGDKGLDVSAEYGITLRYSDLKDLSLGFHERDILTGEQVELPE